MRRSRIRGRRRPIRGRTHTCKQPRTRVRLRARGRLSCRGTSNFSMNYSSALRARAERQEGCPGCGGFSLGGFSFDRCSEDTTSPEGNKMFVQRRWRFYFAESTRMFGCVHSPQHRRGRYKHRLSSGRARCALLPLKASCLLAYKEGPGRNLPRRPKRKSFLRFAELPFITLHKTCPAVCYLFSLWPPWHSDRCTSQIAFSRSLKRIIRMP